MNIMNENSNAVGGINVSPEESEELIDDLEDR